jgi:general secretion pathway protein D
MCIRHLVPALLVFACLTALAQERAPAQPQPGAAPAAAAAPGGPVGPGTGFVPAIAQPPPALFPGLPTVALEPLLQRVGRAANKKFLVDGHVNPQVYLGGVDANDVTFPLLLSILRANNLAVVEFEGRVNVISVNDVRLYPVPFANTDDQNIPADEWRTRVLQPTNIEAAQLVPILRPLLPQQAHLAAFPGSNQLLIVDRYANVKRITEIVRALDKPSPR